MSKADAILSNRVGEILTNHIGTIDKLVENFKNAIINEIENNCTDKNEGTLHYFEYDIPTAYIAKYGRSVCVEYINEYLTSDTINRKLADNIYEIFKFQQVPVYVVTKNVAIKENQFILYEDKPYSSQKYITLKFSEADGILLPIVIGKSPNKYETFTNLDDTNEYDDRSLSEEKQEIHAKQSRFNVFTSMANTTDSKDE